MGGERNDSRPDTIVPCCFRGRRCDDTAVSELNRLIACHECAVICRYRQIPVNARASCPRCGALLYRHLPDSLDRSLALYLTALMLWLIANLYPFLGLKVGGIYTENLMIAGAWALFDNGMGELGLVVFLTSIAFPFLTMAGMVYLLLPLRFDAVPPFAGRIYQMVKTVEPWSLISVFMLGTLIAIVKLQDLATVVPGLSLFAFAALLIVYATARSSFDSESLWQKIEEYSANDTAITSLAEDEAVLHCHICGGLQLTGDTCQRCGAAIHYRIANSIQQTWALLFAAVIMLIPANIYPVMTVKQLGKGQPDTIVSGTIHLLAHYNELCRTTSDYEGAVHQAVQEVATPLIISSLALSLGFGILLFSNFTIVAQFGALAAATMLISIFANLLITPIIMTRVRLVGLYQIIAMHVDKEVLGKSPLLIGMTNYERKKAILISEIHHFEAGGKLVIQGDIGRNMYMILEGNATVQRNDGDQTRILAELKPGEVFGEVGYIRAIERTADVIAATPVTALNFEYQRMQKDLKFFPNIVAKLNFNISGILGERLADVLDSK